MKNSNVVMNWSMSLHRAQELRSQGASLLFERVKLLQKVYEDDDFQAWCRQTNTPALDYVDSHFDDVGLSYMGLLAVQREFPDEDDWKKTNIRKLSAMAREKVRKSQGEAVGHRVNYKKKCEQLARENAILRQRVEQLEKELSCVAA